MSAVPAWRSVETKRSGYSGDLLSNGHCQAKPDYVRLAGVGNREPVHHGSRHCYPPLRDRSVDSNTTGGRHTHKSGLFGCCHRNLTPRDLVVKPQLAGDDCLWKRAVSWCELTAARAIRPLVPACFGPHRAQFSDSAPARFRVSRSGHRDGGTDGRATCGQAASKNGAAN
jgi:hypothetical protein